GVHLFARAASCYPDLDVVGRRFVFRDFGYDLQLEFFKRGFIAEEACDTDEKFLAEKIYFLLILSEKLQIIGEAVIIKCHSARQPPDDGRPFIKAEIASRFCFYEVQDFGEKWFIFRREGIDDHRRGRFLMLLKQFVG